MLGIKEGDMKKKSKNTVIKNSTVWEYLCLNILILIGLVLIYQLWRTNIFKYPLQIGGDATQTIYGNKLLADTWVFGFSERVSYPYYAYMSDFPNSGLVLNTIRCLIFKIIKNPALAINAIYISGYMMAGSAAYWALKKFNVEKPVAAVGAILYTFMPFHFFRGISHLTQGMYWPVPIFVYFLINYMKGNNGYERSTKGGLTKDSYIHILILLYLGGHSVYYTFFSSFFVCVLILWMFICQRYSKLIKQALIDLMILLGSVMITLGIYVINVARFGGNSSVADRVASEIEIYGLKIGHLILPINGHRIPFLAELRNEYNSLPLSSESYMASLGLLITIGFVLLLVELIKKRHVDEEIYACAVLNLAALLLSTVGGAASVIALFFAKIRCYNRISIYIAFFAVVCFVKVLNKWVIKVKEARIRLVVCMFVLAIGIFDQTSNSYIPLYEYNNSVWESDADFISRIEEMEEEGAKIYQIPYVYYPEAAPIKNMNGYDHAKGYIHSESLVWSFGAYKGRLGDMWNSYVSTLNIEEQVYITAMQGFDGIYVDSTAFGKEEFESMSERLKACTGTEPIVSNNKKLYYFTLQNYNVEERANNEMVMPGVFPTFGETFYSIEKSNAHSWRWCKETGEISIMNSNADICRTTLSMTVSTCVSTGTYTMDVYQDGQLLDSLSIVAGKDNKIIIPVELVPGNNEFVFETDIPTKKPQNDSRTLAFCIKDFSCRQVDYDVDLSGGEVRFYFGDEKNKDELVILKGISEAESGYAWTDGKDLEMYCNFGEAENVNCEIAVNGMVTKTQKVMVEVNGERVLEDTIYPNESIKFSFENEPNSVNKINLLMPEAISLYELGTGEDRREMAFMIREICFSSEEKADVEKMLDRIVAVFEEGTYNPEIMNGYDFRWCAKAANVDIINKNTETSSLLLTMDVLTYTGDGTYTIDVYQNRKHIGSYSVYAGMDNKITFPVELKQGKNEFIFASDIPAEKPDNDKRRISFGIKEFRLVALPDKINLSEGTVTYTWGEGRSAKELTLVKGISEPESGYAWTNGKNMEMYCDFGDAENVHCEIAVNGMITKTQKVMVEVNGVQVLEETIYPMESINFSFKNAPNSIMKINVLMPEAISPYELGTGDDRRELAFMIREISFSSEEKTDVEKMLDKIVAVFEDGAYNPETMDGVDFRWCAETVELNIINKNSERSPLILSMDILTYISEGAYTIDIYQNKQLISSHPICAGTDNKIELQVELEPGENKFEFVSDIPAKKPTGDERAISFGIREFKFLVLPD